MELARRLREKRERLSLTQERVARALGAPRELLSYWENGTRVPNLRQLQELARVYNTTPAYLLGEAEDAEEEQHVLLRGVDDEGAHIAVRQWIGFLDSWADFLKDIEHELPGPGRPPKQLDEGETVTDMRRVPVLANKVREHFRLGQDAMPDPYTFLDEKGYLVIKANLGPLGQGADSISGAFYNHPRLGFSILVNTDTSPGRQAFTLAHEFAHSLYHHAVGGIICRFDPNDPVERFANAFAASFLIPGKELRIMTKKAPISSPADALSLATYFGVSYAMILVRLVREGLITSRQYEDWRRYSASSLASQLGLNPEPFRIPEHKPLHLDRYPLSVLELIKQSIERDLLSPKQAAGLLGVTQGDIQRTLLSDPPLANDLERQEHAQFAVA